MPLILKNKDTIIYKDFNFRCSIGKKGKTKNKIEGDNKTPVGTFKLGNLYYRKDRVKKPRTKLKSLPINKNLGWCNDVNSKKYYNKIIKLPKNLRYEKLHRKDYKYNYFIPIEYNTNNIILGKGSAIFIHLTKNYGGTAGCIALKEKDFLILCKLIDKKTRIKIT
tara:strand:- start:1661 stop:2155 length:495 start_codon:yes stop_codon:yes gene_type:complete